jgi:hypothetical protein
MPPDLEGLSQRVRALRQARHRAPYRFLALRIAEEPAVLRIATNLFFAAVQRLLFVNIRYAASTPP